MKSLASKLAVLVSIPLAATLLFPHTTNADSFSQNNIISDAVFDNTTSMTAAQIDSFLNSFANSCISSNSGFRAIDPTGYNPSQGYLYGGFVTAGQVIYDAGQSYGLNPQVLIATLEKEQSLVTGRNNFAGYCNNGDQHKYAAAVGYGCPDSGTSYSYTGLNLYQRNGVTVTSTGTTCVNTAIKAGFSQQVIRAAWLFKFGQQRSQGNVGWAVIKGSWNNSDDPQTCYGGPMTQGTFARCPSGGAAYYDGYTTIDSTAVHMDSGATAALYWYTPHFHGNQNFFSLFTGWFGSTQISFLVRTPSSPTYYLLTNNHRYAIANGDILYAYGIESAPLSVVSDDYLNSIPDGGMLNTIFSLPGDGTVYLADGGKYYGIASGDYCVKWGLSCGNAAIQKEIGAELFNRMGSGGLLQPIMNFGGNYYLMQDGKKQQFLTTQAMTDRGYSTASSTKVINWTNATREFGISLPENNTFVKFADSSAIYLYSNNSFITIPDYDTFTSWFGPNGRCYLDSTSSYNSIPPSTSLTLSQFVSNTGVISLVGYTQLFSLQGANPTGNVINLNSYPQLVNLLSSKQTVAIESTKAVATNGTIFGIVDNALRPIPSMADLRLLYADSNIFNVPSAITKAYPIGKLYMVPGRIFKPQNSGAMYVYGSDKNIWALGSLSELNSVLGWTGSVVVGDFSSIDFQNVKIYSGLASVSGTPYLVQDNGSLRTISPSVLVVDAPVAPLDGALASRIPRDTRPIQFIRFDNGTIFQVVADSIRPIGSISTYLQLGGNGSNTANFPLKSLGAFTIGPVL